MLEDLVSGKEYSRLIVIHDNLKHRGNELLNYITLTLLNRLDAVVLFLFDVHPRNINSKLIDSKRLHIHDGFTDPLNWSADESPQTKCLMDPFYLKEALSDICKNHQSFSGLSSGPVKVGVVINSISNLLCHQDVTIVCKDLFEVMHFHMQACEVTQTVVLVHSDLHDENVLLSLNYIASSLVELQSRPPQLKGNHGYITVTHSKKNGKLEKQEEEYKKESEFNLTFFPLDTNDTQIQSKHEDDVVTDLTFKVTLTNEEKEARAKLQLPYLLDDKTKKTQLDLGNKGRIFYQADEADDLDEEDPDDDLNI